MTETGKSFIHNPILPGFNPDPSIIRVGDDYYIATSTFEWFPGVQIHHSKDLMNWELAARPLSSVHQLDMRGIRNSGGVWAPCLTFDKGVFYLVYSNVIEFDDGFFDSYNYLVTADDICGKWSDPIFLMSGTADMSMFHDGDKKWVVYPSCKKIKIREYSIRESRLVGSETAIFDGTSLGVTEGPHLYKIGGYYYLITAEGGTGYGHAVTVARSKELAGPYEVDPENPVLTSRNNPELNLQKAGHADIVQTQTGEWYMVHLCARPIPSRGMCILGRETAIQKMAWTDNGWLRLEHGGNEPSAMVPAPQLPQWNWQKPVSRDDFNSDKLDINFQTLRIPLGEDMLSLTERPGYLRLKGCESPTSLFRQALVARRQQAFRYTASACVEFEPESESQMAGLICYYNTNNFHYLRVTKKENIGKCVSIMSCNNKNLSFIVGEDLCIEGWERCYLQARMDYDMLHFFCSRFGTEWTPVGTEINSCNLTDESDSAERWNFTGAFVGLCCHDATGSHKPADFDYFEYSER